jgi:hypothetical protein
MSQKRKLSNASTNNSKEKIGEEEHVYENSANTDYNNLDYHEEINPNCYDVIIDDYSDEEQDDERSQEHDGHQYEEHDGHHGPHDKVLPVQTDGEDRNSSNNASANLTPNKASANLTQSNLTSGPPSTTTMYPIFYPQTTNTKDTSRKHANKTYIRPNVTPMDSQPLSSTKSSKVSSNKVPSKSTVPNLLQCPSKETINTPVISHKNKILIGDRTVDSNVVPSLSNNKRDLWHKINILQDQTNKLRSRLSHITTSSVTSALSANSQITAPHNSTKNKKTAKKFRRHQRQKANKTIDKAASKLHASSIMLEVSSLTTIHQLTTTSTTEPTDSKAASELILVDQACNEI